MAYQKKNNDKKNFPKNVSMEFEMYMGVVGPRQYDPAELVEFMKEIPFNKISIPVMAPKSVVFGDDTKMGSTRVGYITDVVYETDDDGDTVVVFKTVIYAKNSDAIGGMETPIMYPRVRVTDDGEIQTIISFELGEAPEDDE